MADLVRHIGSIEEPALGSELELRMEGDIGVNATWLELIEVGESCIKSFWVPSRSLSSVSRAYSSSCFLVRLSFLTDCVCTRHRRAYPYMDFARDEIAGVEANTELVIHRNVATSGHGLHECLGANLLR